MYGRASKGPAARPADARRPLRLRVSYFDFDTAGYAKTATRVSADNSALMRNTQQHEHALERVIARICRAVLAMARRLGVPLPAEGEMRVTFDDVIIADTGAEKRQDMAR